MKRILLKAEAVSKSFSAIPVVDRVSLTLSAGEILTIIGPNGSGKPTLIRLLLGLETPDSGSIPRPPGLRVGYVPQRVLINRLMPMDVAWFLRLSDRSGDASALERIALEVGVYECLYKSIHQLSGGEMQRMLLARALLCEPELLVLDEPAQGVDVQGQADLYAMISRISRMRDMAVLMVSHDLHLVMASTDQVICLNRHVCCSGHPHSVRANPAFATLFGQHVADSLAIYTHHHDHQH